MQLLSIIVALGLCIGVVNAAQAGSIYKWTDSDGVTHFGSAPPTPEKTVNGPVKTIQDGSNLSGQSNPLTGIWWGAVDGYTTAFNLQADEFTISRTEPLRYQYLDREIASGKLQSENGELVFTYFKHSLDPAKVDKEERFEILGNNGTQLELLGKETGTLTFRKLESKSPSQFSREIYGEWEKVDSSIRYIFKHGTLQIDERPANGGRQRLALANWEWQDSDLTLDYVADFIQPLRTPKSARWNLREKTPDRLTFIDVASGKPMTLSRVR